MKLISTFAATVLFLNIPLYAQTDQQVQKVGHVDRDRIFESLPEVRTIQKELATFEGQLRQQLQVRSKELEEKMRVFEGLPGGTPEAIRRDKASELQYLQTNLQKLQADAAESYRQKQEALVAPVLRRIDQAIRDVASENGFSYILNGSPGLENPAMLFANERYNISDLVLKKLAVTSAPAR